MNIATTAAKALKIALRALQLGESANAFRVRPNVFGQTSALGAGTASPATFTPASDSITKTGSGKVLVAAAFSGTASAAGNVTMVLLRDGMTTVAQSETKVATNGDEFHLGVEAVIDTLPDAAAHTYTWTLTNSAAGTFTGLASATTLWGFEL